MVSAAEMKAYAAESRAVLAQFGKDAAERENRLVKWMVALAAGGTTILGVAIGALALFGLGGGN